MSSSDPIPSSPGSRTPSPRAAFPGRASGLATLALPLALVAVASTPALAATYAVGIGTACTHTTIQAALDAAATNPAGPHLIKLTTGTWTPANGVTLVSPQTDITIEGGYSSCGASTPTAGQRTTIDATGGNDGTVLDIRQLLNPGLPYPVIRLSRLTLTGGTPESSGVAAGGGLEIQGRVDVELTNGTRITGNRSGRGGGVFIQERGSIRVYSDSEVSSNIATIDGGGIHCAELGTVVIGNGRVSSNQAGRDGGGIHAVNCGLGIDGSVGATNTLANNIAGTTSAAPGQGRGGAIYFLDNGGVGLDAFTIGLFNSTTLFVGNEARGAATDATVAGAGGGAIYIEGNGLERLPVRVNNAIFVNNVSVAPGAGISVARAVDLLVTGQATRCTGTFGFGLCSAFSGQVGSAIAIDDLGVTDPLRAPHVLVERTRFTATSSAAAVIQDLRDAAGKQIRIRHSVFDANSTTRLLWLRTGTRLLYSTVIDNTFAGTELIRMVPPEGRVFTVELTGSILWQPGRTIVANAGAGTLNIQHSGCLLASSTAGLPAPTLILTSPPALETGWTPSTLSPAVDVCHDPAGTSTVDAYGQGRPVDQPWRTNILGAYDLGAIERPLGPGPVEAIFQNGFE